MKNVKLGLFITALTLAIAIPTGGVYAQGRDAKTKSVEHKIECRTAKTQEWGVKFTENHKNKVEFTKKKMACRDEKNQEWAKKYTENHDKKGQCGDAKITLSAEQKDVIQAKKAEIEKMALANKALNTKISEDKVEVKAELARIEAAKLVISAEVQTKIDEVIVPEVVVVPEVEPAVVVTPVVVKPLCVVDPAVEVTPVVDPAVEVTPVVVPVVEPVVEKTYFEKLKARFDTMLVDLTTKNIELTSFSDKILSLLEDLKLIIK